MKEPLILCGSLGRPHLPLLKWAERPVILVEPQELDLYNSQHPELEYVVLPKSGQGFSYMMNQMVKACRDRGERYFIFSDDDVTGLRARPKIGGDWKTLSPSEATVELSKVVEIAKAQEIAQVAISFAGQSWGVNKAYQHPVGAWGVYVCDALAVQAVGGFDESLWIFSDWEMSARLIQAGYHTMRTNLVTFVHKMRGMEGGADWLYQHKDRVQEACLRIKAKYGDAVRIEWVPEHGQHEIRFTWKKLNAKG